jgi:hypothetical protein
LHLTEQGATVAALFASLASAPVDIVLTRFQAAKQLGVNYNSAVHCAMELYKLGGVRVFYKGWFYFIYLSSLVNNSLFLGAQYRLATILCSRDAIYVGGFPNLRADSQTYGLWLLKLVSELSYLN